MEPKHVYMEWPREMTLMNYGPPPFKKRRPNFSDREIMALIKEVIPRKEVLLGKVNGAITKEIKMKAWEAVAIEVNKVSDFKRTPEDLRKKLSDYRFTLKKKLAEARQEMNNTERGGITTTRFSPAEEALATVMNDVTLNLQPEAPEEEEESEAVLRKKWNCLQGQLIVEMTRLKSGRAENENHTARYLRLVKFLQEIMKTHTSTEDFPLVLTADPTETAPPESSHEEESNTNDAQSPPESVESLTAFPLEFQDMLSQSEEREAQDNKSPCSSPSFSYNPRKKTDNKRRKSEDYTQTLLDIDTETTRPKDDYKQNLQNTKQNADYNQTLLDIERQKLQYLVNKSTHNQEKQEDEDLMFFKSLLKHVKKIPDHKKMAFRNRIQEAVEQFAYPTPAVPSTQPAPSNPVIPAPRTIKICSSTPPYDMHNYAADLITITHREVRKDT